MRRVINKHFKIGFLVLIISMSIISTYSHYFSLKESQNILYPSKIESFVLKKSLSFTPENIDYSVFRIINNESLEYSSFLPAVLADSLYPLSKKAFVVEGEVPKSEYFNYSIMVDVTSLESVTPLELGLYYQYLWFYEQNGYQIMTFLTIPLAEIIVNNTGTYRLDNNSLNIGFNYVSYNSTHYINGLSYEFIVNFRATVFGRYFIVVSAIDYSADLNSSISLEIEITSWQDAVFYEWALKNYFQPKIDSSMTTFTSYTTTFINVTKTVTE